MTNDESYDSFRTLEFELSRRGLESEAISLEVAIIRGGNRAERLALAGKALQSIRAGHPEICRKALTGFIEACVQEIRSEWPDYG
ncbi:MAG: hypothetical protein Q8J99_10280 [Sulfuritalea sp.]|nr:hypothetical protein [Sulfuritalea sp.]